jgi:hypothetical protein
MTRNQNPLIESAIAIAVGTAIIYCVNAAFYGGYFSSLQLDADLLDRNFHQILYNGFLMTYPLAILGIIYYVVLRIILYIGKILPDCVQVSATL